MNALRAIGLSAILLITALAAAPAAYADAEVLALGDSVMLGAVHPMKSRGMKVDAKVSRQASQAAPLLRSYRSKIPRNVILHFGTNGTYSLATCKSLVEELGPKHQVFLVTVKVPRHWEESNNQMLRRCAAAYPNAHIVDWHWAASRKPGWLYADGYHLRPEGAKNFARIMSEAIARVRSSS